MKMKPYVGECRVKIDEHSVDYLNAYRALYKAVLGKDKIYLLNSTKYGLALEFRKDHPAHHPDHAAYDGLFELEDKKNITLEEFIKATTVDIKERLKAIKI